MKKSWVWGRTALRLVENPVHAVKHGRIAGTGSSRLMREKLGEYGLWVQHGFAV